MFCERQTLDALIQQQTEIVGDPLADAGRQVLLDISADAADDGDEQHRRQRELEHRRRVRAEGAEDRGVEQSGQPLTLQDVVDNDGDGPGFQHVSERFADDGDKRDHERLPVRPQYASEQKPIEPRWCREARS